MTDPKLAEAVTRANRGIEYIEDGRRRVRAAPTPPTRGPWTARCGACSYQAKPHQNRAVILRRLRKHQEHHGHHRPLGTVDTVTNLESE